MQCIRSVCIVPHHPGCRVILDHTSVYYSHCAIACYILNVNILQKIYVFNNHYAVSVLLLLVCVS